MTEVIYKFRINNTYKYFKIPQEKVSSYKVLDKVLSLLHPYIKTKAQIIDTTEVNININTDINKGFPFDENENEECIVFNSTNKYNIRVCGICDDQFNGKAVIMLICRHAYCKECYIADASNHHCPYCKADKDILCEIFNYKENPYLIKEYIYSLHYNEEIQEFELLIDKEIRDINNTFHIVNAVRDRDTGENATDTYTSPLPTNNSSSASIVQLIANYHTNMPNFDDFVHTSASLELLPTQTPVFALAPGTALKPGPFHTMDIMDGICLILRPKKILKNNVEYILGLQNITITIFNDKGTRMLFLQVSGLQLLNNILSSNTLHHTKDSLYIINKNNTIILNISVELLVGNVFSHAIHNFTNEEYIYFITRYLQENAHLCSCPFIVNVDSNIYDTSCIYYKIQGKIINQIHRINMEKNRIIKEKKYFFPHINPFINNYTVHGTIPELCNSCRYIFTNSSLLKRLFIVSPKEIKAFDLQFNGNVKSFEGIITLRYNVLNIYYYVLNIEPGINTYWLDNKVLYLRPKDPSPPFEWTLGTEEYNI